ncbi:hemagglutinin repeat-containing protein, partial [Paraburkholderia jirisanensis]
NTGGRIGGSEVLVQAGRDVINETQTYGLSKTFGSNGLTGHVTGTGVDAMGVISSTGNATVLAGRDVTLTGATIQSGGNTAIAAGRDLNLNTTTLAGGHEVSSHGGQNGHRDQIQQQLGSAIVAGGDVTTVSGRDTTLTGSTIASGGDTAMAAGRDLTVTASKDTHTYSGQSMGGRLAQHKSSSYDEAVNASSMSAGGNLILAAGQSGSGSGSLSILGSNISTNADNAGSVTLISTGDITIGSVSETHDSQSWSHSNSSGFLSKQKVTDTTSSHQLIANGSTVSGDTVTALAGHDMTIAGSTVAATNDVNLAAANSLTVTTTQDTADSSHFHEDIRSGLGSSGGFGISYGTTDTKNTTHERSLVQNGSLIGSTDGSVRLTAGGDLHVSGSDLIAAKDVAGTGANVTIDAATGTAHRDETQEVSKSGFTLAVKAPVLDAISNTVDQARDASRSQDGRAAALHGMAAASGAYDSVRAAGGAMNSLASGQKPDAKIELSYGSSHSKSTSSEDSTTSRGTNVSAGGTTAFVATGSDVPSSGNVTIAGSNVSASDVILAAKNQVNLVNTTDTDTTRSSNQSSSASVGVSYGTQGFGISASMAKAHGDANSDLATQNSTHINAENTATIISGGDTSLIGANVTARQVSMDVGGNLNIASVQDTMTSRAKQESTGGGFSISQGGGSASFSHSSGKANGSYAGVNEQAGIQAGDGGFSITVAGNTDLKGGLIASDAEASKNSLSTATLTFSDIQNHSEYSAHSSGFSAGATTGDGGGNYSTYGNTSGKGTGGAAPMLSQSDSGSDSATTRSAISAGTISVTNTANQKQDIASLSRDTSDTNGTVARLPDLNNLLDRQADMMAAASAAGEAVSRRIGDFAQSKYDEARAAGDQEGMNAWKEGGTARAEMQMAGAALVTGLAGGNALGGAAGAAIASLAAGKLNDVSSAIAGSHPTGSSDLNEALGNIVANAIATGAGGAIAGNAGSVSGYNVDRFNRQLHPDERQWISDNAGAYAKQQGITVEQAITALTAQADRQVQNGSAGAWDANASTFLGQAHGMLPAEGNSGPGYMFYATPDQKADISIYASHYPNGALPNQPLTRQVQDSATREQVNRNLMGGATISAATGAALIVGLPIAIESGVLGYSAISGTTGGGMDAAGQYAQSGTIRFAQTAFATVMGAISGPIGAKVGFSPNVLLGSAANTLNTAFNNAYFGEHSSLSYAMGVGALASAGGSLIGTGTQIGLAQVLRPYVYKSLDPAIPALLQPRAPNPVHGLSAATAGSIASGSSSFVPSKDAAK